MNQYPAWKYLLLIALVVIAGVYAAPNLYPEDYAVQISALEDLVSSDFTTEVEQHLEKAELKTKGMEVNQERILLRFDTPEEQLKARELLDNKLNDKLYAVALNLAPATPESLRKINANPMYLGLDLRGGIHFLMQVDMDSVLQAVMQSYVADFRSTLRQEKIRNRGTRIVNNQIRVRFDSRSDDLQRANQILTKKYTDLKFNITELEGKFYIVGQLSDSAIETEKKNALTQNISALRNRVNALGVSEPVIQRQGLDRVVVQLPGVQDSAKAREILGATATLEYRMQYGTYQDALTAAQTSVVPLGAKLYKERNGQPILLQDEIIVTGDNVQNASPTFDQNNRPAVSITLDSKGANRMLENTKRNVKKPMAVVYKEVNFETVEVDGKLSRKTSIEETVISVATIQGVFSSKFQTTGLSRQEASRLAVLLRSGALKAPMEIVEERTVGPSLGKNNIEQGKISVIVGMVAVLLFMIIYYKVFGLIANVALIVNMTMLIAIMSWFQATLTLPGIAGMVLTVGMAVDANVLIFERIKEELRNNSKIQEAIHQGYDKALSTIADANITTLIAAFLLLVFGTGPIKGFAITLAIGIVTSMLTAIMGTRALVNLIYGNKRLRSIAISWGQGIRFSNIKFMQLRVFSISFSLLLIVGSIVSLNIKGLSFGVDFTGGYLVEAGYSNSADLPAIRQSLVEGGFEDAMVQNFGTSKDVLVRIQPRENVDSKEVGNSVMKILQAQTTDDVQLRRIEFVGPQVGEELREDGGKAILFALIAIVIYVAVRFQLKFSVGAVIGLIHDVIITLGVFSLFDIEFDLTVLAAVLAVVGYSLNDTIVVFDRIRENFQQSRREDVVSIINNSINQTLSRTLMTSVTTLLVLIALYTLGGETINSFAFALIVGVVIGTYSSIFIASLALVFLKLNRDDLIESDEKKKLVDDMP